MSYLKRQTITPKNWMIQELNFHMDDYLEWGEINTTKLAENCADCLNLYIDEIDYEIPEEIFDLAFDVSEQYK